MPEKNTLYVLTDTSDKKEGKYVFLESEKLKEHFINFTSSVAQALDGCVSPIKDMELNEISIQAAFDTEIGFALIGKTGMTGTVTFTYRQREKKS